MTKRYDDFIIEKLHQCLTRQLEAYHRQDEISYDSLEEQILRLEKKL